jgi:hypothetical protein
MTVLKIACKLIPNHPLTTFFSRIIIFIVQNDSEMESVAMLSLKLGWELHLFCHFNLIQRLFYYYLVQMFPFWMLHLVYVKISYSEIYI